MSNSPASNVQEQEFLVKIPAKDPRKNFHIMKFNQSLNMDTSKWTQVRMVRENNRREYAREEDDLPKFGAGSEFGRQERDEARRKKYGIMMKKYNPDNQPWLMRVGSKKEGKQYKGIREGGISENTSYYVFTHAADGSFEAHPVKEWYNFIPRATYRTLNAEEAEEKFAARGKILNHFAVMVNRKLKANQDEDEDLDEEGGKGKKGKSGKDFKVSDMDDWVESGDELDTDSEGEKKKGSDDEDDEDGTKKRSKDSKKKDKSKKKKKKSESDDEEAFEDSDDGDDEGREVDYMSDESSDSEEELLAEADIKGVDQDEGLSKMLESESSSEEDENKKDEEEKEEGENSAKKGKKKETKDDKGGKKSAKSSANNSRATTPTPGANGDSSNGPSDEKSARAEKRKAIVDSVLDPNSSDSPASKKSRTEPFTSSSTYTAAPANSIEAAFEDDVRRYLTRKPMTTTELLKKFKSKKTGLPKDELMPVLVNVLKRVNPHKQKIKGTMYLSLKGDK